MPRIPDTFFIEMSTAAQAALANLDNAAKAREFNRSVADITGSFTKKIIKGKTYWYYQTRDPDGKPQQVYLGPESPLMQGLISQRHEQNSIASAAHLSRLAAAAVALGASKIAPKHGRVIRRMAEYGFFRAGGVLAGTHAFLSYQNMLGVRWTHGDMTMDVDFAHPGKSVVMAFDNLVKVDVRTALESLQMGFIPVHGQARFKKKDEPDFDVDFLTNLKRAGSAPMKVASLGISLQPLKFMELAFEHPAQTVILLNDGPLVVSVPRPEIFAFHKLIVSQERKDNDHLKALKDAAQACALITYFLDNNLPALLDAHAHVTGRGSGWRKRVEAGLRQLDVEAPGHHVAERLQAAHLQAVE